MNVPEKYLGPISLEIMVDPVFIGGYTYEREKIEEHLEKSRECPMLSSEIPLGEGRSIHQYHDTQKVQHQHKKYQHQKQEMIHTAYWCIRKDGFRLAS